MQDNMLHCFGTMLGIDSGCIIQFSIRKSKHSQGNEVCGSFNNRCESIRASNVNSDFPRRSQARKIWLCIIDPADIGINEQTIEKSTHEEINGDTQPRTPKKADELIEKLET